MSSKDVVMKNLNDAKKASLNYMLLCDGCLHYEKDSVSMQSINCVSCLRNKIVKDKFRKKGE